MNVDPNSSMIPDGNKSPEVDEVEAEDSDVKKVPEVKTWRTRTAPSLAHKECKRIICKYFI